METAINLRTILWILFCITILLVILKTTGLITLGWFFVIFPMLIPISIATAILTVVITWLFFALLFG